MNDGWHGILHDDERILWQGRPDGGLHFDVTRPAMLGMGVVFMAFSMFWMNMAARGGGYFWSFGLLFFGVGFFNAVGVHFWKTYVRRNTYYTLTNQNAFIATNLFGQKSLKTYPIGDDTSLEFLDGPTQTIVLPESPNAAKTAPISSPSASNSSPVAARC